VATPTTETSARWELYRLLGEPIRLRLLALAGEEELAVGELAELLAESQPNVSRHLAPLRAANLLSERKQGTRVLVRLNDTHDAVVADALHAGRRLCESDGSLARVADIVRARDEAARAFFAKSTRELPPVQPELAPYLAAFAALIPNRALAIDAATGDGSLLEVLSPIFDRVIAFDREPAQLQRARARVEAHQLKNVTLIEGDIDSVKVPPPGADVVFAARFLHHAPKPAAALESLTKLARPGGAIVVIDYARHDDESMREQADLWLGFEPKELKKMTADLDDVVIRPLPRPTGKTPDAHLPWQVLVARVPNRRKQR
jgi:DNA-binding transcriptional ArsR family regulator/predicted O-methyltransferase YrrM